MGKGTIHPGESRPFENKLVLIDPAGAFDPWGRVIGLTDYFAPGDRTLTVQVPVGGVRTLYARIGDALAWICVAALATALAGILISAVRPAVASRQVGVRPLAGPSIEGLAR